MSGEVHWMTAAALVRAYSRKRLSPVEVVEASLARVDACEAKLNAMNLRDDAAALAEAHASAKRWARGRPKGPLDGVPTLIKDILLTRGWPTLRGSRTVDPDQSWTEDAPSVARLREAGAILLGKTTTPEFGWKGVTDSPLTGITRNPWNPALTPGGSSGGSAAAVAAGYAPLSLGTDGGGSIRIPAGFSGIFGLKPSFGRVPAYPLSPFGTVAHIGPMTRTVEDAAMMMNAIAQPDVRDFHALPFDDRDFVKGLKGGVRGLRIAFSPRLGYANVDPEIASIVAAAARAMAKLGARVVEVDPGFADPMQVFRTLWWSGVRNVLGRIDPAKRGLLDPGLADVLDQSMSITLEDYLEATRKRGELGAHMRRFMETYDLLLTPSLPIAAFEAGRLSPVDDGTGKWVNWTPFSFPFNLTQQPAASVPCGFTRAGLPVGLHIVGRMYDDWTVLRAAHAYERAHDWVDRRPPL